MFVLKAIISGWSLGMRYWDGIYGWPRLDLVNVNSNYRQHRDVFRFIELVGDLIRLRTPSLFLTSLAVSEYEYFPASD